jgi:hypothetical protein
VSFERAWRVSMRELDWRRTEMRVVRDEWRAALADTRQAWEAAYEG